MPIYLFTRQLWNRSVRRRLRRHEQSFVTSQLWHTGRSGLRSSDTTQPLSHSSSLHQRFVYVSHRQCYFRQQNLKWKRQATEQGLIQKSSMEEDDGISEQKPSEAPPPQIAARKLNTFVYLTVNLVCNFWVCESQSACFTASTSSSPVSAPATERRMLSMRKPTTWKRELWITFERGVLYESISR